MLPDISNRIRNLSKALESVIIPAIPADNSFAAEQAALMLGHLKMLDQQWDFAYLYEKGSFENMLALATQLTQLSEGGNESCCASAEISALIASLPEQLPLTVNTVNGLTIALGKAVDRLVVEAYKDGNVKFKAAMLNSILDYNHIQCTRERTWFKANMLDPDVRDLPSMQEMLTSEQFRYSVL
ncbi:MAG: hypothetical protein ACI8RU_003062 [Zhongshania aliphaticivorans]|jgi:hypothetical protein|uniref:hypothetical protein n=1 Tax=Zhongshania aliphaticivorans TaxID=1470434 RepID=UPI0039E6798E|tara:strand:+ start:63848 stop:64399 length:552 start_codon:yes stop_codon:yes gene_type:complete